MYEYTPISAHPHKKPLKIYIVYPTQVDEKCDQNILVNFIKYFMKTKYNIWRELNLTNLFNFKMTDKMYFCLTTSEALFFSFLTAYFKAFFIFTIYMSSYRF